MYQISNVDTLQKALLLLADFWPVACCGRGAYVHVGYIRVLYCLPHPSLDDHVMILYVVNILTSKTNLPGD